MEIALIMTTVNRPDVLRLYREYGPNVHFIVAGDLKSPHDEIRRLVDELGNATYLGPVNQAHRDYKCSEVMGWNTIARRNIALLEAMKREPDIIVSVDDDNIPMSWYYFWHWDHVFQEPSGLQKSYDLEIDTPNVGSLFDPPFNHRGVFGHRDYSVRYVTDKGVGLAEGIVLGDPDTNAIDWISGQEKVTVIPEILREGVFIEQGTWAAVNTQNTAFLATLAPAMAVWPGVGRYDDIWALMLAQVVMGDYRVAFGPPFVWQARNPHDHVHDLERELLGMRHAERFAECLDEISVDPGQQGDLLSRLTRAYEILENEPYIPDQTKRFWRAWLDDCKAIC
jgi:hypothetical protein